MEKECILLVEDEQDILELTSMKLHFEGYKPITANSGKLALKTIESKMPDLILLDLMLPDIDGFDICRLVKNNPKTKNIPIIMMTAKVDDTDIVAGLTLGADDYITKPFNLSVLVARIKAVLRRKRNINTNNKSCIEIQDLQLNPETYQVISNGNQIDLTNMEFQALYLLSSNPGRVFTRDQIAEAVKGNDICCLDRSIDALIVRLRKKLNSNKNHIETVWGIGYRFKGTDND